MSKYIHYNTHRPRNVRQSGEAALTARQDHGSPSTARFPCACVTCAMRLCDIHVLGEQMLASHVSFPGLQGCWRCAITLCLGGEFGVSKTLYVRCTKVTLVHHFLRLVDCVVSDTAVTHKFCERYSLPFLAWLCSCSALGELARGTVVFLTYA